MKDLDHYHAVVFDMDGLLVDSERIYLECFLAACRHFDLEADEAVYLECIGTSWPRTREILQQGYGPGFPYDEVIDLCRTNYEARLSDRPVPLKEGAAPLVEHLCAIAKPVAVATSTELEKARAKLASVGLLDSFKAVIGGDMVSESKPAPDIYLLAAEALRTPPANCLALEDSDNGVKAAHAAGMDVIQIPDLVVPAPDVRALGHLVLDSLKDLLPNS